MRKLLIICFLFSIGAKAQPPATKMLVSKQTWVVKSTPTTFRVITSNDSVANKIVFLEGITRFTYLRLEDRYGVYWERSFYFDNKWWNNIVRWIDSLNKHL